MALTRFAIARPLLTGLLTLALLVLGIVSWSRMPVDLNPQASLPNVIVTAIYPGAGPSTVEQLVAEPFEEALRGVAGVKDIFSVSQEGFCYVYVQLHDGTDIDRSLESCREAIERISADLPSEVRDPAFTRLDINAQPVVFLGMIGDRPLEDLRRLAEDRLQPRLEAVAGVADVEVLGGREPRIAVRVDREKLLANGLRMSDLLAPLEASSRNIPGGRLEQGETAYEVRLMGEFAGLDDIRNVPIPPPMDLAALNPLARPEPRAPSRAVRLGDVATVARVAEETPVRIRLQQQEAVGLIVTKQGDGNTVQVSRDVRAAAARTDLPADVELILARDTAATVREALADVNASIAVGILLCALTIYFFLRNWRGTAIVATSIPVCLIGTFALMGFGGNTLNQMTLLGLALSVGILVDDSIVCLEAITWRLHRGEPAAEAALAGRNDIALADTSTTLIDLAVFVPIAVMGGVVGQFFRDFGFVVAAAAALSLLSAYTLVPSLAALWYQQRPPERGGRREEAYEAVSERYRGVLEWALGHRGLTLLLGWSGLAVAGLLAWAALGIDFIPAADLSTVVANLEMPAGATSEATEATVAEAERLIADVPDVATLFTTLGKIETGFGVVNRQGPAYAQINITLRDRRSMVDRLLFRGGELRRRSDSEVADELRGKLAELAEGRWQVIAIHGWGGAGAPVDFSLYGDDLDEMAALGETILARLDALPVVLNADMSWRLGQPEVQVELNREAARDLTTYPGLVGRELRLALAGEANLNVRLEGEVLPLDLRLRAEDRRTPADVAAIPVGRTSARAVTIGDVAEVSMGTGPTRIDRYNGRRDLNFKAWLPAGVPLGDARAAIEALLGELNLPRHGTDAAERAEVSWGWRGDAETLAASSKYMAGTALVAAILVYLVMAVLFNSAIHPLTIMLSVPMAGAGALLLLVLTGSSLSIVSGIGMILLLGIVVRNAILLIDHTLQLRAEGLPRHQAVIESGLRRLRPILMTTLTTILGMLPVALKIGKGAEIRAPMAIAVIGGLTLSTLLTLVIIPVTYTLFDDWFGRDAEPPLSEDP